MGGADGRNHHSAEFEVLYAPVSHAHAQSPCTPFLGNGRISWIAYSSSDVIGYAKVHSSYAYVAPSSSLTWAAVTRNLQGLDGWIMDGANACQKLAGGSVHKGVLVCWCAQSQSAGTALGCCVWVGTPESLSRTWEIRGKQQRPHRIAALSLLAQYGQWSCPCYQAGGWSCLFRGRILNS